MIRKTLVAALVGVALVAGGGIALADDDSEPQLCAEGQSPDADGCVLAPDADADQDGQDDAGQDDADQDGQDGQDDAGQDDADQDGQDGQDGQDDTDQDGQGGQDDADPPFYADCDAVRAAGKAPLEMIDPGYRLELDRDGDGVACDDTDPRVVVPDVSAGIDTGSA